MDGLVKAPTNKVGPFISHKFHLTQFHFHYIFHKGCSKAKHEWNHFQEVTKNTYAILSRLFTQAQTAVHCASLSLIPCALISQSDSWHTETDRVWVTKVCSAERNWKEERRTHCHFFRHSAVHVHAQATFTLHDWLLEGEKSCIPTAACGSNYFPFLVYNYVQQIQDDKHMFRKKKFFFKPSNSTLCARSYLMIQMGIERARDLQKALVIWNVFR